MINDLIKTLTGTASKVTDAAAPLLLPRALTIGLAIAVALLVLSAIYKIVT